MGFISREIIFEFLKHRLNEQHQMGEIFSYHFLITKGSPMLLIFDLPIIASPCA
jgi:hypothetical protein